MKNEIEHLDSLLRTGNLSEVERRLSLINPKEWPRPQVAALASIARRAGVFKFSLRLLNPFVRPSIRRPTQASPQEKLEYGAALGGLGAVSEGLTLLKSLAHTELPELSFHIALLHFREWEYREAIPHLKKFITQKSIDPYRKLVGQLNLAAAFEFVYEDNGSRELEPLLHSLAHQTRTQGFERILANTLELTAQVAIKKRHWREAEELLRESGALLRSSGGTEPLFVRKWQAILKLFRGGDSEESQMALREVREIATRLRAYETLRDCDYHEGLFTARSSLISKVYFGTPYPSYRARLEKELERRGLGRESLADTIIWNLDAKEPRGHLDLSSGENSFHPQTYFKPQQKLLTLLRTLAQDFYKPSTTTTLFSKIYPDRHFNLESSPNCVYQLLHRLRQELARANIPLTVFESRGDFTLSGPLSLKVCSAPSSNPPKSLLNLIRTLQGRVGDASFTSAEAAKIIKTSRRSMNRLLTEAVHRQLLDTEGRARATRYKIASLE